MQAQLSRRRTLHSGYTLSPSPALFPFSLLSDRQIARAIFTLILELALFALALLSLRLTDWKLRAHL